MNRSNSADSYVPSIMSFVGLEGSRLQPKPHIWEWETNNAIPSIITPTAHQPFLPLIDYSPQPPLLPTNNFPFYPPLIKREEGLGLNLGHRTYFSSAEGAFTGSRGSFYSLSHPHHNPPKCQAEGCKADLSGAKHYHRRHKVCEFHSKAAFVVVGGQQQRFCQQCSRFHVLAEFDEAKRSCRKRLADHNRRRRKPAQPQHQNSSAPKNHNSMLSKSSMVTETSSTLSLGGMGEESMGWAPQSLYQHQLALFHHQQNAYCSTSNQTSQPTGSDHLHNLGFEMDFV